MGDITSRNLSFSTHEVVFPACHPQDDYEIFESVAARILLIRDDKDFKRLVNTAIESV